MLKYHSFLYLSGDQLWCTGPGPIGFLTNGVAIYNALTDTGIDAVKYEKVDACQGLTASDGTYHYNQFSRKIKNLSNYK